jgi:hypothetical protein
MATTRKSAKRGAGKKGTTAKRSSTRKSPRKSASKGGAKRSAGSKAASVKRKAKKGLKAARAGLKTARQAGEKTWRTLRAKTAQVVEGVKDTLNG